MITGTIIRFDIGIGEWYLDSDKYTQPIRLFPMAFDGVIEEAHTQRLINSLDSVAHYKKRGVHVYGHWNDDSFIVTDITGFGI